MKTKFPTKLVGVTFGNAQQIIPSLVSGMQLKPIRESDNIYDNNAIAVFFGNHHLGYLSKAISKKLAPLMDEGAEILIKVINITGGSDGYNYGVNVSLQIFE